MEGMGYLGAAEGSEQGFRQRKNMRLGIQRHSRHFPGLFQLLPDQSCLSHRAKEELLEAKPAQVSTAQRQHSAQIHRASCS